MERTPATRAGDADRERALTVLRDATVSGHLTLEEFADRVERTELARTHADLEAVTADLPHPRRRGRPARPPPRDLLPPAARRPLVARAALPGDLGGRDDRARPPPGHAARRARPSLDVRNYFGTITLLVPRGVHVEVDGGGTFETREIDLPDSGPVVDAPRLRLRTSRRVRHDAASDR